MSTGEASFGLHCDLVAERFAPVRDAFLENFAREDDYRDVGAAFCVLRNDEVVVNLAAGSIHAGTNSAWNENTLSNIYSTTKGVVALAVAMLVEKGVLDYEAPVRRYWPEFASQGKEQLTVAQLLSHQAGLAAFRAPVTLEQLYDRDYCVSLLAGQTPFHPPGGATCYHPITYGFLVDELVRRAAGCGLKTFFAERLQRELGLDIFLGCPASERARCARLLPPPPQDPALLDALTADARAALEKPRVTVEASATPGWLNAELPAANGHASAEALARLYSVLANGGGYRGRQILSPGTLKQLCLVRSTRQDRLLQLPMQWCGGLARNTSGIFGPGSACYGHSGWGGSFACADTEYHVAMAFVCNRMGADLVGDPRVASLSNAVYKCLHSRP